MKELLYYPGFEVKDETWLKFALLYLDHISPIIPYINAPEESYLTPTLGQFTRNYTQTTKRGLLTTNKG